MNTNQWEPFPICGRNDFTILGSSIYSLGINDRGELVVSYAGYCAGNQSLEKGIYASFDNGEHWTEIIDTDSFGTDGFMYRFQSIPHTGMIAASDSVLYFYPQSSLPRRIFVDSIYTSHLEYFNGILLATDRLSIFDHVIHAYKYENGNFIRNGTVFKNLNQFPLFTTSSNDAYFGANGIYHSNSGTNWTLLSVPFGNSVSADNIYTKGIFAINDSTILWSGRHSGNGAVLDKGTFRTTDKGNSWQRVSDTHLEKFTQSSNGTLFAIDENAGIFSSINLGKSWSLFDTTHAAEEFTALKASGNYLFATFKFVGVPINDEGNRLRRTQVHRLSLETSIPSLALSCSVPVDRIPLNVSVMFTADTANCKGEVASIEFFVNDNSIGKDVSGPFSVSWTPSATGQHTIQAKACDSNNELVVSTSITVTVTNALHVSSPANNHFTPRHTIAQQYRVFDIQGKVIGVYSNVHNDRKMKQPGAGILIIENKTNNHTKRILKQK